MAVLLPTILPTTYEYVSFTSTHTFYNSAAFLTSISVTVSSVTVYAHDTSKLLIVVGNNNTENKTTGTFLGAGTSLTISGWHRSVFDMDTWKYRLSSTDHTEYSVQSHTLLPETFYKLFSFQADTRPTTTITITVQTNIGDFNLSQTIINDWNRKRNLLVDYIRRGTLDRLDGSIIDVELPEPEGANE